MRKIKNEYTEAIKLVHLIIVLNQNLFCTNIDYKRMLLYIHGE